MKPGFIIFFLLSVFIYKPAYAQRDTSFLGKAVSSLEKQANASPVEKVYLHLSKPYYALGDTIWFKAYTVLGAAHKLSALSGVLYTELVDETDTVVKRINLQLDNGLANGDFTIPVDYKPGNYRIRAYTQYMRNAGTEYFFDQKIRIGALKSEPAQEKKLVKTPSATTPPVAGTDIRFFPEGGELVNGIRSKVAVKAVSSNGSGEDVKGSVVDNDGNEVAAFESQHLGMGVFALNPQAGKSYKAKVTTAKGSVYTIDLPKAQEAGFTLAVNDNLGDSILVKIAANGKLFATHQNSSFYLVAQSGGVVFYTTAGRLESPVFTTRIPKSRFATGIVQFTLFSASGEPLNERVIFIQNPDQLNVQLSSAKQTYATREKVKIDLAAADASNKTNIGTYSVAVTDETRVPVDESAESTILSDLLLTSDLKGYIEMPNYYFTNVNDQTQADLDVLMLTQGYRRFEWKKILSDQNMPLAYQPESSLEISGTVTTNSGRPVIGGKVKLVSIKYNLAVDTVTDAGGNFKFSGLNVPDTAKLVVTARNAKDSKYVVIHINKPDYVAPSQGNLTSYQSDNLAAAVKDALVKNDGVDILGTVLLKEVKVRGQSNADAKKLETRYSSNLNGSGNADEIIMGKDLLGCPNLTDCLTGKLRGVTFLNNQPYDRRAMYSSMSGNTPMSIVIDGMQLESSSLNDVNVDDVYSIEVLTSASHLAIYGSGGANGVIIINLKTGKDYNYAGKVVPGVITYRFNGFYKAREFYQQKYDKAVPVNNDLRSTVYWNPGVVTDKDGKTSFEYFNADNKGTYRVVVQGIDNNGKLGYQVYKYKVE